MTLSPIQRAVVLPAPVEVVWPFLVDPTYLSAWFGGEMHLEARQGGQVGLRQPDGAAFVGIVDVVVPRRRVVFTWWPQHGPRLRTRVTLLLEPRGADTLLRVTESPLNGAGVSSGLHGSPATPQDAPAVPSVEPPSATLSAGAR